MCLPLPPTDQLLYRRSLREEARRRKEEEEQKTFDPHPKISPMSQGMQRSVKDMLSWGQVRAPPM